MTMKNRKTLAAVAVVLLALCLVFVAPVSAEDTDIYDVGTDKTYTTWSSTLNATSDGDGEITYHVYGKVTLDSHAIKGAAKTINIVGKTEDAELTVITAKKDDNGVVYIKDNTIETVNFINLNLSRPNGEYRSNEGHHNRFFTVWDSDGSTDLITYTGCTFLNGSGNNQYGKTTYTNCNFYNDVYYALWIYGSGTRGVAEVTNCYFEADRGVKIYSEDASAKVTTSIKDSEFVIASKPAIVSSIAGTLTIEDIDADACQYGLLATEPKDGRTDLSHAEVTVDGKEPEYVASVGTLYTTSQEYAQVEAKDKGKEVQILVAKVGNTPYSSLTEALNALQSGDTLTLLTDVTITEDWDCRNNGAKILAPVTIEGNGHTIKLTGKVDDRNWNTVFRFEADATVKNLTIDVSEATGVQRGITAKSDLTVYNCHFIGNGARYGIIFGEGATTDSNNQIVDMEVSITKSVFENWVDGVSYNKNGKDVKSAIITDNTFEEASVDVSAYETLTFTYNVIIDGAVQIHSYSSTQGLSVIAKGNTLDSEMENKIGAENGIVSLDADEGFATGLIQVGNVYYGTLNGAVDAAESGDTITLLGDIDVKSFTTGGVTQVVPITKSITIDGKGYTIKQNKKCNNPVAILDISGSVDVTIKNVTFDGINGGAVIHTVGSDITIDNCVFQNGTHTQYQGLLRLALGNATVTNRKFIDNNCNMVLTFNFDAGNPTDELVVDNCLFENNTCNDTAVIYYAYDPQKCTLTNSKFIGNTVNSAGNGATVYLGFTENNVITGNLFKDNSMTASSNDNRVAGGIFFGYATDVFFFSENAFIGNSAIHNAVDSKPGQDVCISTYFDCTIDLSNNYFDDEEPVEGDAYFIYGKDGAGKFMLKTYYTTYELDENGNVVLSGKVAGKDFSGSITSSVAKIDFASVKVGYSAVNAKEITVTNAGIDPVTITASTSTGNYIVGVTSDGVISGSGTATVTIQPKAGLSAGKYSDTLTIKVEETEQIITIPVSFTVSKSSSGGSYKPSEPETQEEPEQPEEPETPAPILAVLAGLGAAVVLRRK